MESIEIDNITVVTPQSTVMLKTPLGTFIARVSDMIQVPDRYRLADGCQPRVPEDDEPYINSVGHVQRHKNLLGAIGPRFVLVEV